MIAMPRRLRAGIIGARRYRNGQASVGRRSRRSGWITVVGANADPVLVVRRGLGCPRGARLAGRQLEPVRRRRIAGAIAPQPVFRPLGECFLDRSSAAGEHHRERVEQHVVGADRRSGRQVEDDRVLGPEGLLEHRVQAIDNPSLAEVVVHDEHPAGPETLADVGERLRREQIALEPDVAVAAVEHERIDERVDDQVVLLVRRPQVVPAIVQMHDHAGIRVGVVRMIAPTEPVNHRVDLDRIDARRAPLQGAADVVARPRADHEDLGEGWTAGVAIEQMWQRVRGKALSRELICWWPIRLTVMKRGSSP